MISKRMNVPMMPIQMQAVRSRKTQRRLSMSSIISRRLRSRGKKTMLGRENPNPTLPLVHPSSPPHVILRGTISPFQGSTLATFRVAPTYVTLTGLSWNQGPALILASSASFPLSSSVLSDGLAPSTLPAPSCLTLLILTYSSAPSRT